jgi:hypothetical protein
MVNIKTISLFLHLMIALQIHTAGQRFVVNTEL